MKVYIVTSGIYSDYRIEAVFSTREAAELFIATNNTIDYPYDYIEEYEMDDNVVITDKGIYQHYRYYPRTHVVSSVPTFNNKEPYIEKERNWNSVIFHYWSVYRDLDEKTLADEYNKYKMEKIESEAE